MLVRAVSSVSSVSSVWCSSTLQRPAFLHPVQPAYPELHPPAPATHPDPKKVALDNPLGGGAERRGDLRHLSLRADPDLPGVSCSVSRCFSL